MDSSHNVDQAVPENWITSVNEQCDLDLAFEVLQKFNHFHTDTIRGRVRSLQLRPQEAWEYFQKAEQRADLYEKSKHNLLRRFYLKAYCFENCLIEKSSQDFSENDQTEICLQNLFNYSLPPFGIAEKIRTFCHGMYLIHKEDYISAKNLFEQLIHDSWDSYGDELTGFYFAAAVSNRGLGEIEKANRHMENSCLSIPTLKSKFNMEYILA